MIFLQVSPDFRNPESQCLRHSKFRAVEAVELWDERSLLVPSSRSGKSASPIFEVLDTMIIGFRSPGVLLH